MKNALIFAGLALPAAVAATGFRFPASNTTDDNPRVKHFRLAKGNLAIDGYDPVSYFQSGPKKGNKNISYKHKGIVYRFASVENRDAFKANPDKYEPVWGGWCGHAMAVRGDKVTINPLTYKIVNGRNILFYNKGNSNALVNWEKELAKIPEDQLVKKGDDFWSAILKK